MEKTKGNINSQLIARSFGLGICFMWVYCAAPPVTTSAAFASSYGGLFGMLLRFATVGFLVAVILPFFHKAFVTVKSRRVVMAVACLLEMLGCSIVLLLPESAVSLPSVVLLSDFLSGGGSITALILWGVLLHEYEVDANEATFIATFAIAGLLIIVVNELWSANIGFVLLASPILIYLCYAWATKQEANRLFSPSKAPASHIAKDSSFWALSVKACLSITLLSFAWEMLSSGTVEIGLPKLTLFGVGLVVSSVMLWAFTHYSSSVTFNAAARCILPAMAISLLLYAVGYSGTLLVAFILLAAAHATFETVLRMQIIGFSQRNNYPVLQSIGWGFSAIALGAFLGPSIYYAIVASPAYDGTLLIIGLLTVLVVIGVFLFPQNRSEKTNGDKISNELQMRSQNMSEKYGLSPRETEILGYLLEGRSHPYIRDALYISISTVNTHVRHIYEKTSVNTKQGLIDLSKQ